MADAYVTLIAVQPAVAVKSGARQKQGNAPQAALGARGGLYETFRNRQVMRGRRGASAGGGGAAVARPTAPAGLEAQVYGDTVTLIWDAGSGAATYAVWWGTSPVFTRNTWTRVDVGDVGSWMHLGRAPGTYYYAVVGVNSQGEGPASTVAQATVLPPVLRLPREVVGTRSFSAGGLWWDEVDGATGYAVYLSTNPECPLATATRTVVGRPPFALTDAAFPGNPAFARVATLNGLTESDATYPPVRLGYVVTGLVNTDLEAPFTSDPLLGWAAAAAEPPTQVGTNNGVVPHSGTKQAKLDTSAGTGGVYDSLLYQKISGAAYRASSGDVTVWAYLYSPATLPPTDTNRSFFVEILAYDGGDAILARLPFILWGGRPSGGNNTTFRTTPTSGVWTKITFNIRAAFDAYAGASAIANAATVGISVRTQGTAAASIIYVDDLTYL